jgi:hypothetical protein
LNARTGDRLRHADVIVRLDDQRTAGAVAAGHVQTTLLGWSDNGRTSSRRLLGFVHRGVA